MKKQLLIILVAVLAISCRDNKKASETNTEVLTGTIQIDGSSTVFPVTEAVAEEYRNEQPEVKVTIGVSGTGGGFNKFSRGETNISNASRPIKDIEIEACKQNNITYVELEVAYDGLAVLVNPENTWVDSFTIEELKKIWEPEAQGKIMNWKQVNEAYPDATLSLLGPGTASGTFDYFI